MNLDACVYVYCYGFCDSSRRSDEYAHANTCSHSLMEGTDIHTDVTHYVTCITIFDHRGLDMKYKDTYVRACVELCTHVHTSIRRPRSSTRMQLNICVYCWRGCNAKYKVHALIEIDIHAIAYVRNSLYVRIHFTNLHTMDFIRYGYYSAIITAHIWISSRCVLT